MPTSTRRDTPINIRATADDRQLIDRAADALGKSRTEFILDAARSAAKDALLDQTYFELSDEAFDALLDMLEQPAEPAQALRDLMAGKYDENDPW